ncbi:MAG: hypothetical protein CMM93_04610 [Rickettsiales bacterium]|nr:hypothetical protein [Rickettsiales bacterium]|tara:strand:+ start:2126 stop:2959 length:834 start_codon:yes stop_codon:yes gene_type:complete
MTTHVTHKESGFTLVELAIVLVIIGLIVGGVLVGQDLIKAAEIRATVSDLEKFNAASTTFRDKYSGYPGDLLQTKAAQFGLANSTTTARPGADGQGDSDGLIENGATNKQGLGNETLLFWSDLTQADMIATSTTPTAPAPAAYTTTPLLRTANIIPVSRLRDSAFVHVYSYNGRNYYYLGGLAASNPVAATGVLALDYGVTPQEALSIDEKLDDGDGDAGIITAVQAITNNAEDTGAAGTAAFDEAQDCFVDNTGLYNVSDDAISNINCRLSIRASF